MHSLTPIWTGNRLGGPNRDPETVK
jgi:hypothetical protein